MRFYFSDDYVDFQDWSQVSQDIVLHGHRLTYRLNQWQNITWFKNSVVFFKLLKMCYLNVLFKMYVKLDMQEFWESGLFFTLWCRLYLPVSVWEGLKILYI